MTRRRRRGRSGGHGALTYVCCVLLVGSLVVGVSLPAASFTHGEVPRGSTADVSSDESGALALDTARAVHVNDTTTLVNVTNWLGRDVTVTVSLRDDSTHVGDLVVDGTTHGNETTFALSKGATESVRIKIPDDSSLTDEVVYFHVTASASGLAARATDRSVPVNA